MPPAAGWRVELFEPLIGETGAGGNGPGRALIRA